MNNCSRRSLLGAALVLSGLLACSGCNAQGYITSTVQSVIGLDVSENPKTQVPHVRFGFVRSQYYYLPTGKSESANSPQSSGKANETPNLVSQIYVNAKFLQGTEINERFAVGEAANTPAAQALFGATQVVSYQKDLYPLQMALKPLIREKPDKAKSCISGIASGFPGSPDLFVDDPPGPNKQENLKKLKDCLEKP